MSRTCLKALDQLIDCMLETDCVRTNGEKAIKQCLRDDADAKAHCDAQRLMYFECKHGQMNMRKRFKGNIDAGDAPAAKPEGAK